MKHLLFLLFLLALSACDDFFDDPRESRFKMNEHYIVVDYNVNGACSQEGVEFIYEGKKLVFSNGYWEGILLTSGTSGAVASPDLEWATNHNEKFTYLSRGFIKADNCRLLVDVDAVKAVPKSSAPVNRAQVRNQPTVPFHLELTISTGDATATIDATYMPYTWDQFPKCRNDGEYTEAQYPKLYRCIESMTPHEVVNLQ